MRSFKDDPVHIQATEKLAELQGTKRELEAELASIGSNESKQRAGEQALAGKPIEYRPPAAIKAAIDAVDAAIQAQQKAIADVQSNLCQQRADEISDEHMKFAAEIQAAQNNLDEALAAMSRFRQGERGDVLSRLSALPQGADIGQPKTTRVKWIKNVNSHRKGDVEEMSTARVQNQLDLKNIKLCPATT